jgi:hypothetical protein
MKISDSHFHLDSTKPLKKSVDLLREKSDLNNIENLLVISLKNEPWTYKEFCQEIEKVKNVYYVREIDPTANYKKVFNEISASNASGIKLHPRLRNFNLKNKNLYKIIEKCENINDKPLVIPNLRDLVVDVDIELGLVKVVQIATAQDVGRSLNPLALLGQIEGGIAQGLGLAVMEEIIVQNGIVKNPSFTDYLLPTALDAPNVLFIPIEEPDPQAPLGAKGVGEPPCISVTPAIVAAIRDATGIDLKHILLRRHVVGFHVGIFVLVKTF